MTKTFKTTRFTLSDGQVISAGKNIERTAHAQAGGRGGYGQCVVLSTGEDTDYVVLSTMVSGDEITLPDDGEFLIYTPADAASRMADRVWLLIPTESYDN